jgi:hypothetical protein
MLSKAKHLAIDDLRFFTALRSVQNDISNIHPIAGSWD